MSNCKDTSSFRCAKDDTDPCSGICKLRVVRFWRADGKWHCAEPSRDILDFIPGRLKPGWKHYGLIGRGDTREAAREDWESWRRAADFVADIY